MPVKVRKTKSSPATKNKELRYALLSVFDKNGVVEIARILSDLGYGLISTGGTAKTLESAGLSVIAIQKITGNPESFGGRMKTISFAVEGGILFDRTNRNHVKQAKDLRVPRIDIVIANLYPFEQTVEKKGATNDEVIEMIDVGGPTMVRSAAKNYKNVLVITDPADYDSIGDLLKGGEISLNHRKRLAQKAFSHLSFYDSQIAEYLKEEGKFSQEFSFPGRKILELRYGENPHQKGAVYIAPGTNSPMRKLEKLAGSEPSATNILDIAAGLEVVRMFDDEIAAAVIKHNSPSGIALGKDSAQALSRAIEADPVSAFGGVIVLNNPIDIRVAKIIAKFKENHGQFDVVAATDIDKKAAELITSVRKRTALYKFGKIPKKRNNEMQIKPFDGGFVLQEWDLDPERSFKDWKVVTRKKPTKQQLSQMKIAWKMIGRIKSNTVIVIDPKLPMTRGIGSGQTSRVASTNIALSQAGKFAKGAILGSDSFFPFDDSVKLAAKAGINAIVQQGGSINDQASIDAANEAGIVMVLTGERKFWH